MKQIIPTFENFNEKAEVTQSKYVELKNAKEDIDNKIAKEAEKFKKANDAGDEKGMKISKLIIKKLTLKKSMMEIDFDLENLKK